MDIDPSSRPPRKHAFTPKKLGPRKNKPVQPKTDEAVDVDEADDDEIPEHLIRRVNEHLARERPRAEKKSKQVAFAHGFTHLRTYGKPREEAGRSDGAVSRDPGLDNKQNLLSLPSTAETDGVTESSATYVNSLLHGDTESSATFANELLQKKKDYKEPWDYHHSYYPMTLPVRRPYSGDPELLDDAEFGEAAANLGYDENSIRAASDLGLLEEGNDPRMLFLQLPATLPKLSLLAGADGRKTNDRAMAKGQVTPTSTSNISDHAKGKEKVGSLGTRTASIRECSLEDLPRGYMGKMLVYKSGAVKLKLGDILYDVSPGSDCSFAQNVVAMNTVSKHCCELGELGKRAVVSPDIDFLLDPANQ